MTSTTPKLTRPEMARLVEIGKGLYRHELIIRKTTGRLVNRGLLEVRNRRVSDTGRLIEGGGCFLTDAGRAILAGFPDA